MLKQQHRSKRRSLVSPSAAAGR